MNLEGIMIKTLTSHAVLGQVKAPGSKSYGHRALIALALSKGKGTIDNVEISGDIMATLKCLEDLGVDFFIQQNQIVLDATRFGQRRDRVLKPEESGSTLRFFIPITLLFDEVYEFRGSTALMKRPLNIYEELFKDLDILMYRDSLESLVIKGKLEPGNFTMRGDVSSQFVSGMLMVMPLLSGDSTLTVTGELESASYVNMTIDIMKEFGVNVVQKNQTYFVEGNQSYLPRDYHVEGDFSQVAYFMAAGALAGDVIVTGLDPASVQGDMEIVRILKKMGADLAYTEEGYQVKKSQLKGLDIDISQIPDLAPILGIVLSLSLGGGKLLNGERLRYKESNRIEATIDLINTLGGDAKEVNDDIVIKGFETLKGGMVSSFRDHRMVMAAAVASLRCEEPVIIEDYRAVNKSYPDFFNDLEAILK